MSQDKEKIFLDIASYCDPELLTTIKSALVQADYKDRINLGICYQSDNLDDLRELKKIKNCEVIHIAKKDSRGSVYARYLCQKLIKDEKYVFQVDSHMRFVKHWDTLLINQLESLNDKKAILSTYPPNYDDMINLPVDDKIFDNPTYGAYMYATEFKSENSYFLNMCSNLIKNDDINAYKKNPFISGNYLFSYSNAYKEVLFDTKMFFYGDELPMAIRFYTHGWNVYSPGECYAYHRYGRNSRSFPNTPKELDENERFKELLNINNDNVDLGIYGLGKERTLKDYEEFSGVHFKDKIIYMNAETGEIDNKEMINKISYFKQKEIDQKKLLNKDETIDVIIIDLFNDYKKCINSCILKSTSPNKINFLIATVDKNYKKEKLNSLKNVKKMISINSNLDYTSAISKLTKYLGKGYCIVIDSSFRFSNGWDNYYRNNIKMCGENAILTSWIWNSEGKVNLDNYESYTNIIKEFKEFNNYLPVLHYNENINLNDRNVPYQTAFISDGFIFCKSDILKQIPVDPKLTYEEHQFIYSIRLWTNGINIYYPRYSFFIRTKNESNLYGGVNNQDVVCALSGIYNYYSKRLKSNYKYDIGNIRPLWTWYEFINVDYDINKYDIKIN